MDYAISHFSYFWLLFFPISLKPFSCEWRNGWKFSWPILLLSLSFGRRKKKFSIKSAMKKEILDHRIFQKKTFQQIWKAQTTLKLF